MTTQQAKELALTSIHRQRRERLDIAHQVLTEFPLMMDTDGITKKLESARVDSGAAFSFVMVLGDLQTAEDILQGPSLLSEALASNGSMGRRRDQVWKWIKNKGLSELHKYLREMDDEARTVIVDALIET